jgi:dATP pyrophosphohydrolase
VAERRFKIPVSVLVVIHDADLNVLLLERADRPGFWQSVTGSLDEPDEDLRAAALREVAEETGIRADPASLRDWQHSTVFEIYGHWRARYGPGVTHNTEHVFSLCVPAGTVARVAPREHLAHAWLPWHEAAQKCFSPSNAEAILRLPDVVTLPDAV